MTEDQMREVFADFGYDKMFTRFQTPLYVSGLLDEVDENVLEDFFANIELNPDLFFDEFRFWFQYFSVSQQHP